MPTLKPLSRFGARLWLILLCTTTFFVSLAAPVDYTASDPQGTLLVSQALLEHGTLSLNAYPEAADLTYRLMLQDGRLYHAFPLGTALLALPAVWLANRSGLNMALPAHDFFVQDLLAALTIAGACALFHALATTYISEAPGGAAPCAGLYLRHVYRQHYGRRAMEF